jgi:SAM-dependent methyltransferase
MNRTASRVPPLKRLLIGGCLAVALAAGVRISVDRWANRKIILPPPPRPDVDAPYIPTPQDVVEKILELAEVRKDDLVYDLGCGDGRIVVTAARKYGCRAVGFDNNPKRVKESLQNAKTAGVQSLVSIRQKDIFTVDLSEADVVTLYLLPRLNLKLIPQLEKLKPGARVVSHDWDLGSIRPDRVVDVRSAEGDREHTLYLWTAPIGKQPGAAPQ